MIVMRLKCYTCSYKWAIAFSDNWKSDRARTCPNCGRQIDRQTWDRQILPALAAASDANGELYKDATGTESPLFSVSFIHQDFA